MNGFKIQAGFTLIELMVSIVLGLLVTAAAVQLFITGQVSLSMQRALADIQDNANFGLNYIVADVRKINLGASTAVADDKTLYGGVIVSTANVGTYVNLPAAMLSQENSATDSSNVGSVKSDQLTIQYQPVQNVVSAEELAQELPTEVVDGVTKYTAAAQAIVDAWTAINIGTDCTGRNINLFEVKQGVRIVQRYFLRQDTEGGGGLALACAASRYTQDAIDQQRSLAEKTPPQTYTPVPLTGATADGDLAGSGQIIMRRVDYFHVLFGIAEGTYFQPAKLRYVTIPQYLAISPSPATAPRPSIRSIQLGVIARASDSVGQDSLVSNTPTLTVLEKTVTVAAPAANTPKYLRQVVSQTVAIRNGMGEDNR